MAQIPNTRDVYVGDGKEDTFQVTFQYQQQDEVFVTVDGLDAAFTFISGGWVQLSAAPAYGAEVIVFRSTGAFSTRHTFENGVPLLPRYIDENNKQFLYLAQEAVEVSDRAEQVAVDAAGLVQAAVDGAAAARLASAGAVQVANDALASAQDANDKADAAALVANGIAGTAQGALDAAATATLVANEAKDTADLALGLVSEAGVQTFNGRAGVVVPESGDYTAEQITRGAGTVESALRDVEDAVAQKLANLGTAAIRNAQVSPADATADALLVVGAFGLGSVNVHIAHTNLNDISKTGFYKGYELVNAPLASAALFYVLHQEYGGTGYSWQIATEIIQTVPKTYQRLQTDGTWHPWQELLHTGNLLQTTGTSTDFPMSQAAVTNAINSSSIGVAQTWQDVTASRASGTTYTNTTGKPIQLSIVSGYSTSQSLTVVIGGVTVFAGSTTLVSGNTNSVTVTGLVVPSGMTYSVTVTAGFVWKELR